MCSNFFLGQVGTYKKLWDHWLKHRSDNLRRKLQQKYRNPHGSNMHYDNTDFYMQLVVEGETNDKIKSEMVIAIARYHNRDRSRKALEDRESECPLVVILLLCAVIC